MKKASGTRSIINRRLDYTLCKLAVVDSPDRNTAIILSIYANPANKVNKNQCYESLSSVLGNLWLVRLPCAILYEDKSASSKFWAVSDAVRSVRETFRTN